jgi:hypothetical protein
MEERLKTTYFNYIAIYPRDMSTPNISITCPPATVESSMSFKASSSLQVTASKSARGYRDFKIPRVRLIDCLILVTIIFWDLVGRLSSILRVRGGLTREEEGYCIVHNRL